MDKELLMLYGAKHAVLNMVNKGSHAFAKKINDERWETVEWIDICDYLLYLIDKIEDESEE